MSLPTNISVALDLLQEGKQIYHKDSDYIIYQLFSGNLKKYRKYDNNDFYSLLNVSDNEFNINCSTMLYGWELVKFPVPMSFIDIKPFYENGFPIRRIGSDKLFNINKSIILGIIPLFVTLEDLEARDWEVVE
jgi:hypothetical protein